MATCLNMVAFKNKTAKPADDGCGFGFNMLKFQTVRRTANSWLSKGATPSLYICSCTACNGGLPTKAVVWVFVGAYLHACPDPLTASNSHCRGSPRFLCSCFLSTWTDYEPYIAPTASKCMLDMPVLSNTLLLKQFCRTGFCSQGGRCPAVMIMVRCDGGSTQHTL